MKDELLKELKAHSSFKISVSLFFAAILIFSIQLSYNQANQNSGQLEENVQNVAELREASAFMTYYNDTNQSEKYSETRRIMEKTLGKAQRQSERSQLFMVNAYADAALKKINPIYPEPCSLGLSGEKCYLYIDDETLSQIKSTLNEAGTNESLRDFSSKHNLTAPEDFYTNYSKERFTASSNAANIDSFNDRKVTTSLYTANILYMTLLGLILSSIVSRTYREVRGR
ncbi:hypothetical protein [Candidatus Nanohalovita haloferacivicina]|uniref:hypothetical protein n=1 Tax=Candidatus Nanohalovita haloferacivicina TaxID=2978046 RepID=UPI00325F9928|nr:hypothetical protein HBNXNv_0741 [Candidatus Nanohalobia archaeon BNXNv]